VRTFAWAAMSLRRPSSNRRPSDLDCTLDNVYSARSDTVPFGESVYGVCDARPLAEKALAPSREAVISVPGGEMTAALGFTQASRLPLELELIRSHYSGPTFIVPVRSTPQVGATLKLSLVASVVKGRSVGRGGGGRRQPRAQSGPERSSTCCASQGPVKCTCVASPHGRPMRAFTASIRRRTPNWSPQGIPWTMFCASCAGARCAAVEGGRERCCGACLVGKHPVSLPASQGRRIRLSKHV
jgi:hypothetical protein